MFFVGGLLVGLGIGELFGNRHAGALLGLGIAFLAQGITNSDVIKKWISK